MIVKADGSPDAEDHADGAARVMIRLLTPRRGAAKMITLDNSLEFADHWKVAKALAFILIFAIRIVRASMPKWKQAAATWLGVYPTLVAVNTVIVRPFAD